MNKGVFEKQYHNISQNRCRIVPKQKVREQPSNYFFPPTTNNTNTQQSVHNICSGVNPSTAPILLHNNNNCNNNCNNNNNQNTMEFKERLRKFDSHSSVSKEFRVFTIQGAALSVVTCLGAFLCLCVCFVFRLD